MNHFTAILDEIPQALLVIFRLGGLMIFGPVFGSSGIPVRIKVLLSFLLGLAVYPVIAANHLSVQPPLEMSLWSLVPLVGGELLVGLVIGFLASLPLIAMQTGGLIMGQQMGLGFAMFFNPAIDTEADILGQILFYMALAGFLAIGGHESMVLAVLGSFSHIPLGTFVADANLLDLIFSVLLSSFELAMRVSAPLLAIIFLETIALGFLSKTVPQLNILSLGFPARIIVGLAVIVVGLAAIHEVMMDAIDESLAGIFEWIQSHGQVVTGAAVHG